MNDTRGYKMVAAWFATRGQQPFPFQITTWQHYLKGDSGLVNAPTGFGKTFSVFLALIIEYLNNGKQVKGTQLIWVTPLRSLAQDIQRAMTEVIEALDIPWQVSVRNGDTPPSERQRQKSHMPQVLITTPETLHLLFAQKGHTALLQTVKCVAVDEWHELLGNKRGVLMELALAHLRSINPELKTWGISATIGNLAQALDVLVPDGDKVIVRSDLKKPIDIIPVIPDDIEVLPWAGHMGLKMAAEVVDIILQNNTTLVFTNTRNQAETWYQTLLKTEPELAGQIALHHGSIDFELRQWIETALQQGVLKAVVCTSSLDLGVDFKPVDTVVQIGSPKGVARFLQRAGRSGHSPFETSRLYFLPTHALELVECSALRQAASQELIEPRIPLVLCYDVLVQYLVTLAVGDGLDEQHALTEIMRTHAFAHMQAAEWQWVLSFVITGGESLQAYDEFQRVEWRDGLWKVVNRRIAMRHRLQIGVIVSDAMLKVQKISGGYVGMVEEYFASRLNPGDAFVLAGNIWEFVMIKDMTVKVKRSQAKNARAPSWGGGRMPLSANLTQVLRQQFNDVLQPHAGLELQRLTYLFTIQKALSHIPRAHELLIEIINTDEGQHIFIFPFEGRLVHEVLAALVAYRLSRTRPLSFSMAMNDYGFELLSAQSFELTAADIRTALSPEHVLQDLQGSINASEMASRKFRDVATISGLVFTGYPGHFKTNKNLQSTSGILFKVFEEHDPGNLLLRQAYEEVYAQQIEDARLMEAMQRMQQSQLVLKYPSAFTPLSFPIKVDSLRDTLSSEKLEDRIQHMKAAIMQAQTTHIPKNKFRPQK